MVQKQRVISFCFLYIRYKFRYALKSIVQLKERVMHVPEESAVCGGNPMPRQLTDNVCVRTDAVGAVKPDKENRRAFDARRM